VKQKEFGVKGPEVTIIGQGTQVLHGIADARRVTARQIALAFLTRLQVVFAIPKAASGTFRT